jgi:hypothetical protein
MKVKRRKEIVKKVQKRKRKKLQKTKVVNKI